MSAAFPKRLRWCVPLGIAAVLLTAFFLLQIILPRAGARMLSHWQEAGFPGQAPLGDGPRVRMDLPPTLSWSHVRWIAEDSVRVACEELRIAIEPLELLRGRLRISRVTAAGLRIDAGRAVGTWGRAVLTGLSDTLGRGEPVAPGHAAIRFELSDVGLGGDSLAIDRLVGWGWAPRRGSWEGVARVELGGGRVVDIAARGAGSAGAAEVDAEITAGVQHRLDFSARHSPRTPWTWRASALDDGRLLLSLPPVARYRPWIDFHGEVDLWIERAQSSGLDGEAHLRNCRFSLNEGPSWTVEGTICLSPDTLSLEDLYLRKGDYVLKGQVAVPVGVREGTGWCDLSGTAGRPYRVRGSLRRIPGRWTLSSPRVEWGDRVVGPLEVSADPSAPRAEDRVRGELFLGEGRLSLLGGSATRVEPLRFRLSPSPIESILPLLPLDVPGKWTGMLRTDATVWRDGANWFAVGGSTLAGGRVADVPLLEEAGALLGMPRQGSVRIDRVRAAWIWADGRFWADSLTLVAKELRIEGSIGYAKPDSVLGLLRIASSGDGQVAKFLRLLGGSSGLTVGVSGDPARPTLEPVDGDARPLWIDRMRASRPRGAAS